jgi:hypothetical protein
LAPESAVREEAIFSALGRVLARYEDFHRLGALAGEGGERAFRGWLLAGFLQPTMGWDWRKIVLGESLDIIALDWRDHAVVYIETKTPDSGLRVQHRLEMINRAPRWGSLQHLFLTNGRLWERFDLNDISEAQHSEPDASYTLASGQTDCLIFFDALDARKYLA